MPKILSTKTLKQSQRNLLLHAGCSLIEYNAIHIEFLPLQDDLPSQVEFAIITSKNAFKAIKDRLHIHKAFCVGDKTKSLLLHHGVEVVAAERNAKTLAHRITDQYRDKTDTLHFFCSSARRIELPTILSEFQVDFTEHVVYKTKPNFKKIETGLDGILFYSPSGVQAFLKGNDFKNTPVFCIGPTTASEAKRYFNTVVVANSPRVESVIAKAASFFRQHNSFPQ